MLQINSVHRAPNITRMRGSAICSVRSQSQSQCAWSSCFFIVRL